MKFLKPNWQLRTLLIVVLSTFVGLFIYSFEFTPWAGQINQALQSIENAKDSATNPTPQLSESLKMILPFVKVVIFTLVPALLVVGIRAFYRLLFRTAQQTNN